MSVDMLNCALDRLRATVFKIHHSPSLVLYEISYRLLNPCAHENGLTRLTAETCYFH